MRCSLEVLELWEKIVESNINKFGDEKWLVYEQVYIASLDNHNFLVSNDCLAALKSQYPNSIRVNKLAGMISEASGNFNEADKLYKAILSTDETNAHVSKRRVACLKAQNKTKEYITELNEYLKIYQTDQEAWLELCDAYLNELEYGKAAFCVEELILAHPYNHVYHQKYADIRYTQGNFELARSYYSFALKLNPNNVRALYGLMLSTTNLKSTQKSKESTENSKLATWASEQLTLLYSKQKKDVKQNVDTLGTFFKYLSIGKN